MPRKRSDIMTQSQQSEMEEDFYYMTESQSELEKAYYKQQSKRMNVSSLKMKFMVPKPVKVDRGPPKSITIIQTAEPSTDKPKFFGTTGDFAQVEVVIPDERKLSEVSSTEKSKKKGGVMKWMKLPKKGKNSPAADESVENNTVFITINSTETASEDAFCAVESTDEEVTCSKVMECTTASEDYARSKRQPKDKVSLMPKLLCCQIAITDVDLPKSSSASVGMSEEENSLLEGANEESKELGVEVDLVKGVSK